jgi:hypothetical protein
MVEDLLQRHVSAHEGGARCPVGSTAWRLLQGFVLTRRPNRCWLSAQTERPASAGSLCNDPAEPWQCLPPHAASASNAKDICSSSLQYGDWMSGLPAGCPIAISSSIDWCYNSAQDANTPNFRRRTTPALVLCSRLLRAWAGFYCPQPRLETPNSKHGASMWRPENCNY